MPNPTLLLDFWFSDHAKAHWWQSTAAFDAELKEKFGALAAQAADGELAHWANDAESCLALILLLDQLPRNLHRDSAKAFATDGLARYYTYHALNHGFDALQPSVHHRMFMYLPLEHSEILADQRRCVELMATHLTEEPTYLSYARKHLDIVARFGRFPHRNAALGRVNTPVEEVFLKTPNSGF